MKKDYDLEDAFAAIEDELISSMMRNMKRHRMEEIGEEKEWEMWQALQLKSLEEYKKKNQSKFTSWFSDINEEIEKVIRKANETGHMDQEISILEAIKKGFKGYKRASSTMQAEFFRLNERKLDALIKATTSDMKKAEMAILRMANDQYRKIIFNAQVYANTGAGTYEQAVDMATKDMLASGLNCVEYSNGARHTLQDYADMAIRTASKRAYLQGEGTMRQEWGISTVIMIKRGNPCPLCLPFCGKVLIDDVWSGGSAKDGPYPLMSYAISQGLYHPRCKDSHTTYFEGISTPPDDVYTQEEIDRIIEENKREQKHQYAKRQVEKYERLEKHALDDESKRKYHKRKVEWQEQLSQLDNFGTEKSGKTVVKTGDSGIISNKRILNRARKVKTQEDLRSMSNSQIINMNDYSEIQEYFLNVHGVEIVGFEKKDLFDVKATLAGYDDILSEFPESKTRIKSIRYNPHLKVCGNLSTSGLSQVGPAGLKDYGTGIHEASHAYDLAKSKIGTHSFSEQIVTEARKRLHLKINSKEYRSLVYQITGSISDANNLEEIFAFAIETAKSGVDNRYALEIYKLIKEIK